MEALEFLQWAAGTIAQRRDEALRLLLACALGGWIGLERESSGKPAGFRTNLIICLGAALVTEISIAVSRTATATGVATLVADPGRIAAQVVSGIGFLGAGTIIQSRGSVTGLTTAATLWVVAMIGIGVGAQAYVEVIVATVLVVTALRVLGRMDDHLLPARVGARVLEISLQPRGGSLARVEELLRGMGATIRSVDIRRSHDRLSATLRVAGVEERSPEIADALLALEEVQALSIR